PDGKRLASAGVDRFVRVWEVATGQPVIALQGDAEYYNGVAFSPDGTHVVSGGERNVTMWDAATGEVHYLRGHTGNVMAVAFSPDGTRLASGGWDNAVKVWDTSTGKEIVTLT